MKVFSKMITNKGKENYTWQTDKYSKEISNKTRFVGKAYFTAKMGAG
jgi:hypothetical protein